MRGIRAFATAVLVIVSGCGDSAGTALPARDPGGDQGEVRVSCGGTEFPATALDGPIGAETADTPEAKGLRSIIDEPDGIGRVPSTGWRLLEHADDRVSFGTEDAGGLTIVELQRDGERWVFAGYSEGCMALMVVPPDGLMPAVWWPDPDAERDDDDLVLHVLATDRSCASGKSTGDRLRGPTIEATDDEVIITFTATPLPGDQTCPSHPPTAYKVHLEEPIGDRHLKDGAYWPPRAPAPEK